MNPSVNKFSTLLFDFDNTLVDFNHASKTALWSTFQENDIVCTEEIYHTYKQVNHEVWSAFERGELDALILRSKRFELLFDAIGTPHLDASAFGRHYLTNLIQDSIAYEGVHELLDTLRQSYKLGLVTNGLKEVQRPRLQRLNMTHYFDSIVVSDEIGVAKPHEAYFTTVYDTLVHQPQKTEILIIGDNLNSDILGGRDFGIKTCWVSHGKENASDVSQTLPLIMWES